ncbi:MAG: protein-disulfide reductase DsbD domain-containing protein [Pseudomonadota bacterium]
MTKNHEDFGFMRHIAYSLLLLLAALAAGPAMAVVSPDTATTERTYVRLMSEVEAAAPGSTTRVGLDMTMASGWHTYWKNPGDSGMATTVDWTLPEGVGIGEIAWPAPHRKPVPPMVNYGYEDGITLTMPLTVPADWPVGQPVDIAARAMWLVCAEICIPEEASFTLSVPTGPETVLDDQLATVFSEAEARQPLVVDWPAGYERDGDTIRFWVAAPELTAPGLDDVYFFADRWGVADHAAAQTLIRSADGLVLETRWGGEPVDGTLGGVLTATDRSSGERMPLALALTLEAGAVVSATAVPGAQSGSAPGAASGGASGTPGGTGMPVVAGLTAEPLSLGLAVVMALAGGLILNLMPCVFPVLALKALSLAGHAQSAARERMGQGLAYTAGVLVSFLAFAGLILALRSAGETVGWGFQLQTPIVVAALAYLLFAVGLNLAGVFEISGSFSGAGSSLAARGGTSGSFFTGILAALVASPCTAPFMGAALGFALTQSVAATLAIFTALGVGFALPIMALSMAPGLARMLPRPGAWMVRFRQVLAFPMFAAAAWLLWVFGNQTGVDALFAALLGLILIGFAGWALGIGWPAGATARRFATGSAVAALLGAGYALAPALDPSLDQASARTEAMGEAFAPDRLATLRAEGRTVFVNVTADWCISCKVNERVVLASDGFVDAMVAREAVYLTGDWTRRDEEITALLAQYNRVGVPLYLVYRGDEPAVVLPQILTLGIVEEALGPA